MHVQMNKFSIRTFVSFLIKNFSKNCRKNMNINNQLQQYNFDNFWQHYDIAQKWIQTQREARNTFNECNSDQKKDGSSDNAAIPAEFNGVNGTATPARDDDGLNPEMIKFIRTTLEHRRQRDEKRKRMGESDGSTHTPNKFDSRNARKAATAKENVLVTNEEIQEHAIQTQGLYGAEQQKNLQGLEEEIRGRFQQEYDLNKPQIWPNLSFRFH